jgi:hypothetical protein
MAGEIRFYSAAPGSGQERPCNARQIDVKVTVVVQDKFLVTYIKKEACWPFKPAGGTPECADVHVPAGIYKYFTSPQEKVYSVKVEEGKITYENVAALRPVEPE